MTTSTDGRALEGGAAGRFYNDYFRPSKWHVPRPAVGLFWRSRRGNLTRESSPVRKWNGKQPPGTFQRSSPPQPVMDDNRITTDNLGSSPINLEQRIGNCCFVALQTFGIFQGHIDHTGASARDFGVAFPPPRFHCVDKDSPVPQLFESFPPVFFYQI